MAAWRAGSENIVWECNMFYMYHRNILEIILGNIELEVVLGDHTFRNFEPSEEVCVRGPGVVFFRIESEVA